MQCKVCGNAMSEYDQVCLMCGTPVEIAPSSTPYEAAQELVSEEQPQETMYMPVVPEPIAENPSNIEPMEPPVVGIEPDPVISEESETPEETGTPGILEIPAMPETPLIVVPPIEEPILPEIAEEAEVPIVPEVAPIEENPLLVVSAVDTPSQIEIPAEIDLTKPSEPQTPLTNIPLIVIPPMEHNEEPPIINDFPIAEETSALEEAPLAPTMYESPLPIAEAPAWEPPPITSDPILSGMDQGYVASDSLGFQQEEPEPIAEYEEKTSSGGVGLNILIAFLSLVAISSVAVFAYVLITFFLA